MIELHNAAWRKSTRSSDGECVEVADNLPDVVAVRDSKDPGGGALVFPRPAWAAFIADLKTT